jgi:hypothetical protein
MDQWGPLEIILVLVLVLGVLGAVGSKNQPAFAPTTGEQSLSTLSEKDKRCGLTLGTPKSLERVKDGVRLSGSVSGCKWKVDGTTALYAQIVNGGGAPVSAFTTVPILTTDTTRSFFDTVVSLENAPASGTGYLILIPAVADSDAVTVRIPLRFTQ